MSWREAVVLLVGLLAATGCSDGANHRGEPSDDGAARQSTSSATTPESTAVRRMDPWVDGVTERERVGGTCQPSGFTTRADVHRCFVDGNRIADPCFANPARSLLACPVGAAVRGGDALIVVPREPLEPRSDDPNFPLAPLQIDLTNGDRCMPQGGTTPEHEGVYFEFGCEHGDATDVREQRGDWTVTYHDNRTDTTGSAHVAVLWR
ncbi:MAG TPA: hypothetical protein VGQ20_08635 [Acidimicrobiales bacterium]|nr:hypothetical protein [Acidimicrobiales bacterium]